MNKFSLKAIFNQNKLRISLTFLLVILELISNLLFPLFMGFAINGLLGKSYDELIVLAILVIVSVLLGSLRRFYDSRVYGKVFIHTAQSLVDSERNKGSSTSTIAARINLLAELVEFFENSFPSIVSGVIGILGTLIIISGLDFRITLMCLGVVVFIVIIYGLTSNRNLKLNQRYNDELETLVDRLDSKDRSSIHEYFTSLTRTNIKLSDLETFNFSTVITVAMGIFIVAMMMSVDGETNYGAIFSLLMYVFEFIERVIIMPLYYQNYLRLKEISIRLSQ